MKTLLVVKENILNEENPDNRSNSILVVELKSDQSCTDLNDEKNEKMENSKLENLNREKEKKFFSTLK